LARAHNMGWREWSISLSHDRTQAIAFVVAVN
jgi:phosphopantetheinyl transferase (holo-ACP synthase)